jgi:branched-chain amino acid transport system substrate-binding protein
MTAFSRFAALACASAFLALTAPGHAQEPIKIGAFLSVTGAASFLGDPQAKTLKLYVDKINASGGVLGRKLELVSFDSQGDAKQAVTFVRRLIEDAKVDFLIGGSTTGETMAVVPMVEQAGIPFFSMAGASVVVEPVKKWVFKTPGSDRMAVDRIFSDMAKRGLKNVGLIAGSGGFDQSCRTEAKGLTAKHGITLVADETYAPSDTDMTPQFTRISGAKADAILSCGFGAPTVITVRNYKQLGLSIPFYFTHGVGSQQFVDGARGAADGVRVTVAAVLVADYLSDDDAQKKVVSEYAKEYKAAFNERQSAFGGFAYDALYMALGAIQRAGSTDKGKVRDEIEKTKGFVGLNGIFNMSAADHMGLGVEAFKLTEIRGGDWKLLK